MDPDRQRGRRALRRAYRNHRPVDGTAALRPRTALAPAAGWRHRDRPATWPGGTDPRPGHPAGSHRRAGTGRDPRRTMGTSRLTVVWRAGIRSGRADAVLVA